MTPADRYVLNLLLVKRFRHIKGCIVECGTWRGGMVAGISQLFNKEKKIFLFDSYEGMPKAELIDGIKAINWQNDKNSSSYYDNCKSEIEFAEKAMKLSGNNAYYITKGWFSDSLPEFSKKNEKIAILRLDGDWYESTLQCLNNLYDLVEPGGLIIIDDYYFWDGCTKAIHDFLANRKLRDKIFQYQDDVCYIIKEGNEEKL